IKAHTSLGSQPQKRSQAICAQIEAKIRPPNVNTGNPMAMERYDISSNNSGFTFCINGCKNAPKHFLVKSLMTPYNTAPVNVDQMIVLNFLPASFPCIHEGISNHGSIAFSDNNSPSYGPAIAGI